MIHLLEGGKNHTPYNISMSPQDFYRCGDEGTKRLIRLHGEQHQNKRIQNSRLREGEEGRGLEHTLI